MTPKQQNLLSSALYLFSKNGFEATSTRSIAEKAAVSEGLIFRHFENKKGLLIELLKIGQSKLENKIKSFDNLSHPKVILKHLITIPFNISGDIKDYWRLYYSLKWQMDIKPFLFLENVKTKCLNAFKSLDSSDPKSESDMFMLIFEGSIIHVLLNPDSNHHILFNTILKKYEL